MPGGMVLLCLVFMLAGCGGYSGLAPVSHTGKYAQKKTKPRSNASFHIVRQGETLYSIAFAHGSDYRQVARWNGIRHPYTIYAGQKIRLKAPPRRVSSKKPATKRQKPRKSVVKPAKNPASRRNSREKASKTAKTVYKKGPISWNWPSRGKIIRHYKKSDRTRKGIDINGRLGQAVLAAAGGKVVYSGSGLRGYGRLIIVKHNERFLSAYAHNRKLLVKEGVQVKQGQRIAEMGRSGTDKVKLHFEIRRDGKPINPLRYLPKR